MRGKLVPDSMKVLLKDVPELDCAVPVQENFTGVSVLPGQHMPCAFDPVFPGMPEIPADADVCFGEEVRVLVIFRPAGEPEEMKTVT